MRNISIYGIYGVVLLLLTSVSAFAAEVPAVHLLKGGTQYESALRAAGVPLSVGLNTPR